jgi:phospholipid/cholesterol/gamma-HCH transport system permease protein
LESSRSAGGSELSRKISLYAGDDIQWDIQSIDLLDSASALIVWQAWEKDAGRVSTANINVCYDGKHRNSSLNPSFLVQAWLLHRGKTVSTFGGNYWMWRPYWDNSFWLVELSWSGPHSWSDISNTIYEAGVRALGITALVGFLIGIVLSYLSALQLKIFGAEIYIIDILGMTIIRELGPLLAAILVAGRSGSAMTAQIGIMRVTEELDALSAMGISHSLRLILPKVTALTIVLPLLSVWTSGMGLIGGMFSAQNTLDISYNIFLRLPDAVPLVNVFIGVGKSAVFGLMIALIACHFGFRIDLMPKAWVTKRLIPWWRLLPW